MEAVGAFFAVVAIALIVETVMEYLKKVFPVLADKTWLVFIITAAIGILLCVFCGNGVSIFAIIGVQELDGSFADYACRVLTGIACAGGSNLIYDIIKRIKNVKTTEE